MPEEKLGSAAVYNAPKKKTPMPHVAHFTAAGGPDLCSVVLLVRRALVWSERSPLSKVG